MAGEISLGLAQAHIAEAIDSQFEQLLSPDAGPTGSLYDAMRHATIGGGKRLRPLLVMAAAKLFEVEEERALRAATAIEAIHVYSLIHDDLPCMDDDDLRRGKPTVHIAFDEAHAVLAGDALHDLAFAILADEATHSDPRIRVELIASLAQAAGPRGMAGGQIMDLLAEKESFDLPAITRLQQMKTGALIGAAVEFGAIMGRASPDSRKALRGYAHDLGLAFQIADDILDVEGDEEAAGKALHKDAAAGKKTFLTELGIDRAKEQAAMLIDQAIGHLAGFGKEADLLRAIARYVIERDR